MGSGKIRGVSQQVKCFRTEKLVSWRYAWVDSKKKKGSSWVSLTGIFSR